MFYRSFVKPFVWMLAGLVGGAVVVGLAFSLLCFLAAAAFGGNFVFAQTMFIGGFIGGCVCGVFGYAFGKYGWPKADEKQT